ncbi:Na+/H+ antiporter subunit A [Streptosporangium carneum]|uniref:Na+/H+ antiporter subunit A n=1 Tax=Streptosporangium carneum TaxID=47481 RepID=A0A9W6I7P7_9ACTN|nr:Na+/H+ antiporter subunit A [Streptosporangium carneum]GLK12906.1 Na+/H+ antiporter subunit A [Streptosporangium carneum]
MEPLLILHAVAAVCAPALARRLGRDAFLVLAVPPACGFAYTLWVTLTGVPVESHHDWAPVLGLAMSFRVDALTLLMMSLVTGVGALILVYCCRYFDAGEGGLGRFGGVLVAFAGAMFGLVVADNLLLLYVFWELTTVFSYLLIGHDPESRAARRAATQALTVTAFGGLAMLAGMIILGEAAGTYRISRIVAHPPSGALVPAALVLVLAGALSKSAIFPFSMWLPAAMAAPTPVSAYLHAAAMVKAGIYLLARLGPAFGAAPVWQAVAVSSGLLTMVLAGWRALREYDLKRMLAYGTVSQLGFLAVLFGAATRDTALAGVAMLLAHALFKASLFLVVGVVDHATGTRDLRELSGLRRSAPWLCAVATAAAASMAGIPPFLGFVGKEAAFESLLTGRIADTLTLAGIVAGSALTVAYSARFLWGAFGTKPGREPTPVHASAAATFLPPALLAVLGLLLAPFAGRYGEAMRGYTDTFPGRGHGTHLALWTGAAVPLLLSAVALGGGALLFAAGGAVERVGRILRVVDSGRVYWGVVRGLDRFSLQLTGVTQRGSLTDYLVIAFVSVVGIGGFAMSYGPLPEIRLDVTPWARPEQSVVGALLVATALVALMIRTHIVLALVAGLTGYGTALLLLVHGSPDLALTQFLTETLSLVVFVLVLRRLPLGPREGRPRVPFGVRLGLGLVSGVVVVVAGMLAVSARQAVPVGSLMAAAAERAGAANIVSGLLVDIRAWDTMGESSVLVVLTLGVTSLVFLRRRTYALERPSEEAGPEGRTHWLAATLPVGQRAAVLEIVARLIFHTVLLISVFLLFTGHSMVGGGFAGGIVAGLALVVRYLAGGRYELALAVPVHAGVLIGLGLLLSTVTAFCGLLFGGAPLTMLSADLAVPLVGKLHLSTVLLFDVGVYVSVVGMVQDILRSLGAELDRQIEDEAGATGEPGGEGAR